MMVDTPKNVPDSKYMVDTPKNVPDSKYKLVRPGLTESDREELSALGALIEEARQRIRSLKLGEWIRYKKTLVVDGKVLIFIRKTKRARKLTPEVKRQINFEERQIAVWNRELNKMWKQFYENQFDKACEKPTASSWAASSWESD